MLERPALLARQHQSPALGLRQRTLLVARANLVPPILRQALGRSLQPHFGRNHLPAREPVLPLPVPAQRHQLGAGPNRPHHRIELILAVTVPERELRQIAFRKRCLPPRDRIERNGRIGDDLPAILARDPRMVLDAFALKPHFFAPHRRRPDLVLRLQLDTLRLVAAVIDPGINIERGQALVDVIRPRLAPLLQQLRAVPLAYLRTEPLRPYFAHRQHDMRVRLGLPVLALVPMYVEVRDHAALDKLLFDKLAGERDALHLAHLARNREFHLPRQLRVLANLASLDLVPQGFAVAKALRRALRQHHFGMDDAGLVRKVMVAPKPLIVQLGRGTIGRTRNGA